MSRDRDRLDHLIDLAEAFRERGMAFAVAPLGALTSFAPTNIPGLTDNIRDSIAAITHSMADHPTDRPTDRLLADRPTDRAANRPTDRLADTSSSAETAVDTSTRFVPSPSSRPRPLARGRPGRPVNPNAAAYKKSFIIPFSSTDEPAEEYEQRHILHKIPSDGNGHCSLAPFVRLLGKDEGTIRHEILAHAENRANWNLLAGLTPEQYDDFKHRLIPAGGITDAFLRRCGPDKYLTERHLVLLADLYYLTIPVSSKLGWKHSYSYVPTFSKRTRHCALWASSMMGRSTTTEQSSNRSKPFPQSAQASGVVPSM